MSPSNYPGRDLRSNSWEVLPSVMFRPSGCLIARPFSVRASLVDVSPYLVRQWCSWFSSPRSLFSAGNQSCTWAINTALYQCRGPGQVALGLSSPVFITSLILYVSGVPLLERQHDKKYGDDPRWSAMKVYREMLLVLSLCLCLSFCFLFPCHDGRVRRPWRRALSVMRFFRKRSRSFETTCISRRSSY